MKIIDGKKISNQIKDEIKKEVDSSLPPIKKVPHLAAVLEFEKMEQVLHIKKAKSVRVKQVVLIRH